MIDYTPFWDSLHSSKENTYTLINKHHLSSATIDILRKNKPINTATINTLCRILGVPVERILRYMEKDEDQPL